MILASIQISASNNYIQSAEIPVREGNHTQVTNKYFL